MMEYFPYLIGVLLLITTSMLLYPMLKLRATKGKQAPSLLNLLKPGQSEQGRVLVYWSQTAS